jgi:hypothetical protein
MNEPTLDMLSNLKEYMRKDDVTSFIKTIHKNMPVWNNIKEDILEDSINYLTNYTTIPKKIEEELLDPNPVFSKYVYICVELGANIHKTKSNIKKTLQKIYDTIDRYIVKHKYNIQTYEKGLTNYISFFMYITSLYTPYEHIYTLPEPKDKASLKRYYDIYIPIRSKHIEFIELIDENIKKIKSFVKRIISPSAINKSYKLFKKLTNTSQNRTQRIIVQKSEPNQVKPRGPQHRTYFKKNGKKIPIGYASMVDSIFGKDFRARTSANASRTTQQTNAPRTTARTNSRTTARNMPRATASRTTARNMPRASASTHSAASPRTPISRHSGASQQNNVIANIRDRIKIRKEIQEELLQLTKQINQIQNKIESSTNPKIEEFYPDLLELQKYHTAVNALNKRMKELNSR